MRNATACLMKLKIIQKLKNLIDISFIKSRYMFSKMYCREFGFLHLKKFLKDIYIPKESSLVRRSESFADTFYVLNFSLHFNVATIFKRHNTQNNKVQNYYFF